MKTEILSECLEHGQKLSSTYELLIDFPEAHDFINRFKDKCIVVKDKGGLYIVRLYSDKYEYTMSLVTLPDSKYCICGYTCRANRPMETWSRGNDMCDGCDIKHVLNRFRDMIIDNELQTFGTVCIKEDEHINKKPSGKKLWTVPNHPAFNLSSISLRKILDNYFENLNRNDTTDIK